MPEENADKDEERGWKSVPDTKKLVGRCYFCNLGSENERGVFEEEIERPPLNRVEAVSYGKRIKRTHYLCGVGKPDCIVLLNHERATPYHHSTNIL